MESILLWFIVILIGLNLFSLGLCKYTLSLFSEMRKDYNKIIENCEERINLYEEYFRKKSKEIY
jgi:hypothetical protein